MKSSKSYRTGIPNIEKTLCEIAKDINELFNSVNSPQQSVGYGATGKSGDIRITKDDGGYSYLEVYGEKGWLTSFTGVMVDKPARGRPFPSFPYLEVDNLFAHSFTARQMNAVNGDTIFSDTAVVESVSPTTVTFKDSGNLNLCPFAQYDLIVTRRLKADKRVDVKYVKATVSSVSGRTATIVYTSTDTFSVGDTVVRVGNTTTASRKDSVYIATNPTNSPYIDIYDNIASFDTVGSPTTAWTTATPKVRIGNLAGITDADFGGALSGHGIYTSKGYFKGDVVLTNQSSITISGFNNDAGFITAANAGALSFYGTTEPTVAGNGLKIGDFWFDTNTGVYKMKRCTAVSPSVTWANVGVYMDANGVYAGSITAGQITAGTLTGFTIQTAASGQRGVMSNSNTLSFYSSTGASGSFYGSGAYLLFDGTLQCTGGGIYTDGTGASGIEVSTTDINIRDINGTVLLNANTSGAFTFGGATVATQTWVNTNYDTFPGFGTDGSTACVGNDARLSDARTPTSHNNTAHSETYITGITSLMVTNALGFTPYSNANPSGYQTSADVGTAISSTLSEVTLQYKDWSGANQSLNIAVWA